MRVSQGGPEQTPAIPRRDWLQCHRLLLPLRRATGGGAVLRVRRTIITLSTLHTSPPLPFRVRFRSFGEPDVDISHALVWYTKYSVVEGDTGTAVVIDHHGSIEVAWDKRTKSPQKLAKGDAFDWRSCNT